MAAIEEACGPRADRALIWARSAIVLVVVAPGSVNSALEPLRMGGSSIATAETARMMLEPWLVEAALSRLGNRRAGAELADRVRPGRRGRAAVPRVLVPEQPEVPAERGQLGLPDRPGGAERVAEHQDRRGRRPF